MRTLKEIAQDVRKNWKNVNYGAVPYLDAMDQLESINDMYYDDSADSIVRYFLGNANTFRGEDARRLKSELKSMLTY